MRINESEEVQLETLNSFSFMFTNSLHVTYLASDFLAPPTINKIITIDNFST